MTDKPKQFGREYASIFQDTSVVAAYRYRPPYPPETFSFLAGLIPATAERVVLDAGCVAQASSPGRSPPLSIMSTPSTSHRL